MIGKSAAALFQQRVEINQKDDTAKEALKTGGNVYDLASKRAGYPRNSLTRCSNPKT
jgi:hypothetical protein